MKKSIFILFVVFAFFQLQSVVEVRLRESEDRLTKHMEIRDFSVIIIKGKFKLLNGCDFFEDIINISNFYEDGHTFNFFYEDKEKITKIDGMYWQFGLQDVNGVCAYMTLDSLGVFESFVGLNLTYELQPPIEVFCSLKNGKEEVFRISVHCDDKKKLDKIHSTLTGYCSLRSGRDDHFEKITMQNRFLWLFNVTPIV